MAIAGAAEFGERCSGLITESAQIFPEENIFEGIRRARLHFVPGTSQYERLTKYHAGKTDWVVRSWIDTWLSPEFVLELTPYINELSCPVLALHGDRDEYGSTAQPERLCELAGGSTHLHIFRGCGHVPHREQPAKVLDALVAFLKS